MPVFPPLQLISLYIFGVHNYSFRLISVVFSLLTITVLLFFLKKVIGLKGAIIGSISLAFNFYYLIFSRSAMPEVTMLFFSLVAFIFWFKAISETNHYLRNSLFTGIFLTLAFFTKQLSVQLFAVVFVSSLLYIFFRHKKNIVRKFVLIFTIICIPFTITMVLYILLLVIPNKEIWLLNFQVTVWVNRIHKLYFTIPYLVGEMKHLIISPFWQYLPILTVGLFIYVIVLLRRVKKNTLFNINSKEGSLELLAVIWLIISLSHSFIMTSKFGRFMIPSILPMVMIFSFLFEKTNWKYLTHGKFHWMKYVLYGLVVAELIFNIYLSYNHIIKYPRFSSVKSANTLKNIINKGELVSLPAHWIMDAKFSTVNTFLVPIDDQSFKNFYNQYGWPKYMTIGESQTNLYREGTPILFSQLTPVKKIDDIVLYKVGKIR